MAPIGKKSIALLAFALALGLSACGKKAPLDTPPPKEQKKSHVELTAPAA